MNKIILNSLIFVFILSVKLYCFEDILEDILDVDDFGDLLQIVGIIAMIVIIMYFVKRFIKEDNNLKSENRKEMRKINKISYDKHERKDSKEYRMIEYDEKNIKIKEDKYDK